MRFMRIHLLLATAAVAAWACNGEGGLSGDALEEDPVPDDPAPDDALSEDPAAEDPAGDEVPAGSCPGYVKPPFHSPGEGEDCRSSDECGTDEFCWLPGMSVCGACPMPINECATDEDCGDGICVDLPVYCDMCPEPPGTQCIQRCTSGSCAEGERCDETSGRCVPVPCSEGYTCPDNTRCSDTGGDGHGCVTLTCSTDSDCDCGLCIGGSCMDGPGSCSGLVA